MTKLVAIKHTTETTSVVWCRYTANGKMTVVCNGQTFIGDDIDTTVEDGTGLCTVTGLSAGTRYSASIYCGASLVGTVSIKTMPVAGSTFTFGFGSCTNPRYDPLCYQALVENFTDLSAFVFNGDNIYAGIGLASAHTENSETILDTCDPTTNTAISNPLDFTVSMNSLHAHHRLYWQKASYKALMHNIPCYFQTDDHERPGNDWYSNASVPVATRRSAANAFHTWVNSGNDATDTTNMNNMSLWSRNAWQAYYKGNPSNTHANREVAWPVDKQLYYDFVVGDAHFLVLEDIEYSTTTDKYGPDQTLWVKDVLANSTKTWKIIVIAEGPVDDAHTEASAFYATNDALMSWIAANVTGAIICAGDTHNTGVFFNHVAVLSAGPAGTGTNPANNGYNLFAKWRRFGNISPVVNAVYSLCGWVRVHGSEYLEFGTISDTGEIEYTGRVLPNSNTISYPAQKFG